MAEDKKDDIDVNEESAGKSKLLIIVIAVLALAVIGMGVMMFMSGNKQATEATTEPAEPVKLTPIYHAVETPFIVNFSDQSKGEVRYLQIKLKVMARSQEAIDAFQLHQPAIQHELLMLFYGQKYDELNTNEGTKALQQATLDKINEVLKADPLQGELEAVYFTSLIMQ